MRLRYFAPLFLAVVSLSPFLPQRPARAELSPPVVVAPASVTRPENCVVDFVVTATAVPGRAIVSLTALSLPPGATFTPNASNTSGAFHWATGFSSAGSYTVTFRAVDDQAEVGNAVTSLNITSAARAPVITAPFSQTVNEGSCLTFTVSATDPDGDPINCFPMPTPFVGASFTTNASLTQGTFTWCPNYTQSGVYNVTFTVSNDACGGNVLCNLSASATVQITVFNVDRAPMVTAPSTVTGQANQMTTFTVTASDPDGDAITNLVMSGTVLSTGATFTRNATSTSGTFAWTPTSINVGTTYTATFTASNALSGSANTSIVVGQHIDRAPIVTAPASQSATEGIPLTFNVLASDPDGDAITSLTAIGLPTGATFSANVASTSGTFNWTPSSSQVGAFRVTFRAANALIGSASTNITVTSATGDHAPVVTAPATAGGAENTLILFTALASDADGDPITSFTASGSAVTGGGVFATNATNTSGTFSWTPNFTQAGVWSATFTASNAYSGSATTSIVVGGPDRAPVVIAPGFVSAHTQELTQFTVTAADPDADVITVFTAAGPAITAGGTFASNAAHTSGTFSWTPAFNQPPGSYNVTFTASNTLSGSATTSISVSNFDRQPVVTAPATVSGNEGELITFIVTASDPDGDALTTLTASPLPTGAVFTKNAVNTSGTFSWTPTIVQAGTYSVNFVAANALSNIATTVITVLDACPLPLADAGGPYLASLGGAIQFDGTGSSDPSGGNLSYSWDFGDGTSGTGATVVHTYSNFGIFTVTLTVQNSCGSDVATTTASIIQSCVNAFASGGNKSIRLDSGKPQWCVQVEPIGGCYANSDVILSSIVAQYPGGAVSQIAAISGKSTISGDKNQNGIDEITACFRKEDLRQLFSALPQGETLVDVTIRMDLITGGQVSGLLGIRVFKSGATLAAQVNPNPFNPRATLSFVTTRAGFARARLYDASGRLVRTLMDQPSLAAGHHDVPVDGRGASGEALASGVYWFRVDTAEGSASGRVVLMK